MSPERWQEVERIYQAILERRETESPSDLLTRMCGGDETLRREVASLLDADREGEHFLEGNALQVAAQTLTEAAPRFARGQRLGSYELIEPIGAGGMGEVWRARDTSLQREVAIKFLLDRYALDPDRLRRFEQEARAAGRLNHPNVLSIFAIGHEAGSPYLVTELLEGATLRDRLASGALQEGKALEYAVQIAKGLGAAHGKGIVHRDLKPANIFITKEGNVKILDFGLAKLQLGPESQNQVQSSPGVVFGTPAYMSPEQARGEPADPRSDTFSLGCLLYEMLSGTRPFSGKTSIETMNAILNDDPPPLQRVSPVVEQIVRHCLEKEPGERFQSAYDLGFQLRVALHPSTQSQAPPAKHRTQLTWAAIAGIGLIATTAAVTIWVGRERPQRSMQTLTRLTSTAGLSTDPALSADGKLLAYASDRSGGNNLEIWVQQVGKGEAIRLTSDPSDDMEPSFSPDGSRIAFRSGRDGGGIYVVGALGGAESKIASGGRRPRFSPDGNWIAYWSGLAVDFSRAQASRTFIVPAAGGQPRMIQEDLAFTRYPVWAPDGKHILFVGSRVEVSIPSTEIDWWVAPIDGESATPTGAAAILRQHGMGSLPIPGAWSADGHVLFAANVGDSRNVWQLRIAPGSWRATGTPQRLTSGTGIEDLPSIAVGRVVFSSVIENIDLWALPLGVKHGDRIGELVRVTDNAALDAEPSISDDGTRLTFHTQRSGSRDIWLKDLRTGRESAVTTSMMHESRPAISADGSRVAFPSYDVQKRDVQIALLGAGPQIVEHLACDCYLAWDWSPDNRYLLYWSKDLKQIGAFDVTSRRHSIVFKHPQYPVLRADFSPDGQWVAFLSNITIDRSQIFIAPFRGLVEIPPHLWHAGTDSDSRGAIPGWSPDGNSLYFTSTRDGYDCIWQQRLDPVSKKPLGSARAVLHLHNARRSPSHVQPSFRELAVARDKIVFPMGDRTDNIWMLE